MSRHKHKAEDAHKIGHRPGAATRLRNYFLTGLVIAGPIGITLWLTWTFIKWVDGWVKPFVPKIYNPDTYLPFPIPGFGLIVAVFVLTVVGFLAANFLGRSLISVGEKIVGRMPLVRNIYSGLKQIFETVLDQRGSSFTTAALIEYPRRGLWAIVFISTDTKGEVEYYKRNIASLVHEMTAGAAQFRVAADRIEVPPIPLGPPAAPVPSSYAALSSLPPVAGKGRSSGPS